MKRYSYMISIDPGSKSAWAIWEHGHLIDYGRIKDCTPKKAYEFLDSVIVPENECLVAIEGQWFRLPTIKNGRKQYHSANFTRVIKIVESRCWYQAAAEIIGYDTMVVDPGKWIPAMTRGVPGDTAEKRIKAAAALRHPGKKMVADENAAVLLGDYLIGLMNNGLLE